MSKYYMKWVCGYKGGRYVVFKKRRFFPDLQLVSVDVGGDAELSPRISENIVRKYLEFYQSQEKSNEM